MVASAVFGVTVAVAAMRCLHAGTGRPGGTPTPGHGVVQLPSEVALDAYYTTTDREPELRRESAFRFQGSLWSQEDDFF
jgi:hypothetical protein